LANAVCRKSARCAAAARKQGSCTATISGACGTLVALFRERLNPNGETKMLDPIIKTLRRALLPAVAVLTLFAAIPATQAQSDRQATSSQIDNAQNRGAVDGTGMSGAYAQFGRPHAHVRRYR
jgi:hypothetical protein